MNANYEDMSSAELQQQLQRFAPRLAAEYDRHRKSVEKNNESVLNFKRASLEMEMHHVKLQYEDTIKFLMLQQKEEMEKRTNAIEKELRDLETNQKHALHNEMQRFEFEQIEQLPPALQRELLGDLPEDPMDSSEEEIRDPADESHADEYHPPEPLASAENEYDAAFSNYFADHQGIRALADERAMFADDDQDLFDESDVEIFNGQPNRSLADERAAYAGDDLFAKSDDETGMPMETRNARPSRAIADVRHGADALGARVQADNRPIRYEDINWGNEEEEEEVDTPSRSPADVRQGADAVEVRGRPSAVDNWYDREHPEMEQEEHDPFDFSDDSADEDFDDEVDDPFNHSFGSAATDLVADDEVDEEAAAAAVTASRKMIDKMREENEECTLHPPRFSRSCPICVIVSPLHRAVFPCGHSLCLACAEEIRLASRSDTEARCPICRTTGDFAKLWEDRVEE